MEFLEPRTLDDAVRIGAERGDAARFVAGGTALVLLLRQGLLEVDALIGLRRLADAEGLDRITLDGDLLRIGAGASLTSVAVSPLVREHVPELAHAAAVVGNLRVRNAASLGGNVAEADPGSDPPAVLVNRGARALVVGPGGQRRQPVADLVEDYFTTSLQAGEVLVGLEVPVGAYDTVRYVKFTTRSTEDRPCVGIALGLRLREGIVDELAVTVGAVEPVPRRCEEAVSRARGRRLDSALAREVADGCAQMLSPMSDARGSAGYRRRVTAVLVERALTDPAIVGGTR